MIFALQGADGADADDPGHAELFHGPEVGAMVEFAGQEPMPPAVPREKDDFAAGQFPGQEAVGRGAEGGRDVGGGYF